MFKVATAHSELQDTDLVAKDLLEQCKESLKETIPQGGLLFASEGYDYQALLNAVKNEYPNIQLAGCSSFGEISDKIGVGLESAALILFASDTPCIYANIAENLAGDEQSQTAKSLEQVLDNISEKPVLCCLFVDGLKSNISKVIYGMTNYFGDNDVLIAGGGACDDWKFENAYLFHDKQVASNAASMLIFTEPLKSSVAVRHGRSPLPLTVKHVVTKASNNTVYKIDNKTALEFYRDTLGEHATYEAYSLLIYPNKSSENYLVRAPFKINKEEGSITFPGDVPENSVVGISQLSSQQKTLDAAKECAKQALKTFTGKKIEAALIFSCALRKEILGTQAQKELDLIKNELPKDVPYFGYYTFGEIGPYNVGDHIDYYNETIVIALIGQ